MAAGHPSCTPSSPRVPPPRLGPLHSCAPTTLALSATAEHVLCKQPSTYSGDRASEPEKRQFLPPSTAKRRKGKRFRRRSRRMRRHRSTPAS
ncbi:hypothetical protein BDA96_10G011100 [Sorghum bicolor]|uniref:Uncharacterized protein n=1 Tax=Sorghum bicolor TaxID=4558 RepID=A0A921PZ13_SORBI|nr:hypothetical protein BDA96_10G011100 [Sorghum bicolor]